ncbi:MAG: hypothetical protein BGO01_04690 [Armatimonadetes bacterium 55-13]|nr:alpha/beta fold hydrolase [Armatimonadota bacterium]OJU61391.1 MAG: hypothetical protein BGO01_04690 [Armatimonadetes bacterium 55-13]
MTNPIYFEVHGTGSPLLLSFPLTASPWPGDPDLKVRDSYLERLTDRFQVVIADYPKLGPEIGKGSAVPPEQFTAERACADLLSLADAAGFDQFIFWGYSFGAVMGLQLAARTDRLSALICGGWPPLGAQYADMLTITRKMADTPDIPVSVDQYVTYCESIQVWNEVSPSCPKLAIYGELDEMDYPDGISLRIAPTIREHRAELEADGWTVKEMTGHHHGLFQDASAMVPPVREWLDSLVN